MESGVVEVLGVLSRIRLIADVDVRSFKLGSNKFGFELELALEERSERLGVEDNAACVIALLLKLEEVEGSVLGGRRE